MIEKYGAAVGVHITGYRSLSRPYGKLTKRSHFLTALGWKYGEGEERHPTWQSFQHFFRGHQVIIVGYAHVARQLVGCTIAL